MNEELYNKLVNVRKLLDKEITAINDYNNAMTNLNNANSGAYGEMGNAGNYVSMAVAFVIWIINILIGVAIMKSVEPIGLGIFLLFVFCIGGTALGVFLAILIGKPDKQKVSEAKKNLDTKQNKISVIQNKLNSAASFLPVEYRYPLAVDYMAKMVYDGRANTINEAMDKYDEQLHRWKVEHMQEAILAEQQREKVYVGVIF